MQDKHIQKFYQDIGSRLRTSRNSKNISQEDMGEMLGISYQQIQKYEAGQNRLPLHRLLLWSSITRWDVIDLLGITPQISNDDVLRKFVLKWLDLPQADQKMALEFVNNL